MTEPETSALWEEREAPSLSNSALLAVIGGFLDGFTYVGHGHVFANAMTGNVVLLGIYGVAHSWQQSLRHLPPILTFLVGIAAARALTLPKLRRLMPHTHRNVLLIELFILTVIAFLPNDTHDFWITTSIAFTASMQVETFRTVKGHSFNSTFTTGNLRSLSEGVFDWLFRNNINDARERARDFAVICLAFFLGATIGGSSTSYLRNRALFIDIALMTALLIRLWPRALTVSSSAPLPTEAQRSGS